MIVTIHGGAFAMGDKADGQQTPMLAALDRGYAVVPVDYRLSGEAKFPAAVQDVKAAIRYLRANAAKYGLDPQRTPSGETPQAAIWRRWWARAPV